MATEDEDEAAIFLPHVMFAALAKGDPNFEDRMGARKLANFWEKVKHAGMTGWQTTPAPLQKGGRAALCPFFYMGMVLSTTPEIRSWWFPPAL